MQGLVTHPGLVRYAMHKLTKTLPLCARKDSTNTKFYRSHVPKFVTCLVYTSSHVVVVVASIFHNPYIFSHNTKKVFISHVHFYSLKDSKEM